MSVQLIDDEGMYRLPLLVAFPKVGVIRRQVLVRVFNALRIVCGPQGEYQQ